MIKLMKKLSAIPTALIMFLSHGTSAFATDAPTIQFGPAAQQNALKGIAISSIPQFLVTAVFVIGLVIAVVFLIYGGIKWILSGGDSKQVESARNHIVAAIVGLIIVVGAFVIISIVFQILTGQPFDVGNICIPSLTNPTCAPKL